MSVRFENLSDEFCESIKKQLIPQLERYLAIDSSMEVLGTYQAREARRIVDLIADHIFAELDPHVSGIEAAEFESEDEFETEEE